MTDGAGRLWLVGVLQNDARDEPSLSFWACEDEVSHTRAATLQHQAPNNVLSLLLLLSSHSVLFETGTTHDGPRALPNVVQYM